MSAKMLERWVVHQVTDGQFVHLYS